MAFNPDAKKYKLKGIRKLPVLLLLDVNGSMDGKNIVDLHDAVVEMVKSFVEQRLLITLLLENPFFHNLHRRSQYKSQ